MEPPLRLERAVPAAADGVAWTAVAQAAGVYAYAPDAVIEHMHPAFGKSEGDPVYERGERAFRRDERIWLQRSGSFVRG